MSNSIHVNSRSHSTTRALDWHYDNPDGATFIWRNGVLVASHGPADYATMRAIGRSDDVFQLVHRPQTFSKANSAGQEHKVTFKLCDRMRAAIRWERETDPAEKAAIHIEQNAFMADSGDVRTLLSEAATWLRAKTKDGVTV
jgi:hypothetical protein